MNDTARERRETTRVTLLRHGEPVGGTRYRGSRDDPLSEAGWAQLRAAVQERAWEVIVSSPLQRCHAFAAELAERNGWPIEHEARFREIGFGDWEGLTVAEVQARWGDAPARFWREPHAFTPPGGEPAEAFAERVQAGWQALLQRHRGRRVLVVAHGGVLRMVARSVLEMPVANAWRFRLHYAARVEIAVQHHGGYDLPVLEFLGGGTPQA